MVNQLHAGWEGKRGAGRGRRSQGVMHVRAVVSRMRLGGVGEGQDNTTWAQRLPRVREKAGKRRFIEKGKSKRNVQDNKGIRVRRELCGSYAKNV